MLGLHNDDRIIQIINNLNVVSQLKPGSTLSTSTMTVIDHNAWSGSFWRTYARENRTQTVTYIKSLFQEAISILKTTQSNHPSIKDITINVETAILGLSSLQETYKGDYYLLSEIDQIIQSTKKDLQALFPKESCQKGHSKHLIHNPHINNIEPSNIPNVSK